MDLKNKLKRLEFFIKDNNSPMLVDFLDKDFFTNNVEINANISEEELYGKENNKPIWLEKLEEYKNAERAYLIISDITKITINQQEKFIPIIKNRSFDTYRLPKNTIIIVYDKEYNRNLINKELLSYLIKV